MENNEELSDHPYWNRYRLYTKSVDDYRPIVFNPKYPWWCSGYRMNGNINEAVIIAYLPRGEDVYKYWDDADIDSIEPKDEIEFSERFPKPSYYESLTIRNAME